MKKQYKKALAAVLAVSLAWNLIPNIPYAHASQTSHYIVDDIETLPDDIMYQQVEFGTKKKDLELPNKLEMLVRPDDEEDWDAEYIETATSSNADKATPSDAERTDEDEDETATPPTATSSDAEDTDGDWRMVRVEWVLNERFSEAAEYDGEQPGIYVFDAEFTNDRYSVGDALLPTIEVEVLEEVQEQPVKRAPLAVQGQAASGTATITAFMELSEDVKAQELAVGKEETEIALPGTLKVTLSAEDSIDDGAGDETDETGESAAQIMKNVELTGITWEIDAERSSVAEFSSDESAAGNTYTYVPALPETAELKNDSGEMQVYTLALDANLELPEIAVTITGTVVGYGTVIYEGTIGDCTWKLYDTDGDDTEDLLVIGGDTPEHYPGSSTGKPPWYDYRENIKRAVVEEGVTGLAIYTFDGCTNLKDVTLPSTLVIIRQSAFRRCKSLSSLVIPSGVTEIGEAVFDECNSLVSVTLPDMLKGIEYSTFFRCGLVEIEIPEGVETIGERAFFQCYSLQSVILPDTLISIGEDAFGDDSNLTIIVPEGVQTIGNYAFSDVKAVYNLSDCAIDVRSSTTKVNYDKITLVENGKSSEQRVLPANCVAGSRYANTRYDASYYYSSDEGNTAWYVENGDAYEKVTSGTSFQNTPTFYYAKAFNDTTVEAKAAGESGDSYTLVVKDKETGETLAEGTHYTQEMTGSTDWEETDTGSLAKTVTVTITGIAGNGYVGTMQATFQISAEAEASVTADGNTTKYPAFEDAWKAAQGKTAEVTLLANVEVSATLTVTSDSKITLASGTDSSGNTYTLSGNVFNASSGLINIASGGTLTLESGTVENGAKGNNAIAVNGGHFVLNGGTAAATADGHSGVCVYNRGTAEIQTGNVSGDIGVAAASDGSTITISDGTISGRASGVYVSGSGAKITITGGSISASNTEEKNGADGAALRVQSSGSAVLSGGTYSGAYSIFINSGNSIFLKELLDAGGDVKYAYYSNGVLVTEGLDGKTLTGSLTVGKCEHSYNTWTANEDGKTHSGTCVVCGDYISADHSWGENGKCTAEGCTAQAVASVTVNDGEPAYYPTIEEAWQAAKNMTGTATVTLLTDAVVTSSLTVEDSEEIIFTGKSADGAVHTLSSNMLYYQGVIAVNGGSLLMLDGNIRAGSGGYGLNVKGGSFIMKDGSIVGTYWALVAEAGSVTIDGGTIDAGIGYGLMVYKDAPVTVTLSGGTYIGGNGGNYAVGGSGSVGAYLANGYAYKQGDTWVNDTTVTELIGTVTVEKAPLQNVSISPATTTITYDDTAPTLTATAEPEGSTNDVTYQWYMDGKEIAGATGETYTPDKLDVGEYSYTCTATVDGYSLPGTAAIVTVNRASIENATVTLTGTSFEYIGGTLEIGVQSVMLNGVKLTWGTDYIYSGSTGEAAKTYTVTVEGKGNYTGTAMAEWEIYPRELTVGDWTIEKVYDGTADIILDGTEFQLDFGYFWYGQDDDVKLDVSGVTAQFADAAAGEEKVITYTGEFTLTGGDADNYILKKQPAFLTGTITRRKITITPDEGQKMEYGQAMPALTYTITGDGMAEGESLTGVLACDTGDGAVGKYEITQGTLTATENYDLTFTDGVMFEITAVEDVISVDVTWGAMEFTYTDGAWSPETHTYGNGSWTAAENGDQITVTNNGNTNVTVSYLYTQTNEKVFGSFMETGEDEESRKLLDTSNPIALPAGETKTTWLSLTGHPGDNFTGTHELGIVTVTIGSGTTKNDPIGGGE